MPEDFDPTDSDDVFDASDAEAAAIFQQLIDPSKLAPPTAMPTDAPTEKQAQTAYTWQQSRRCPERTDHFNIPVKGFGPDGEHCLWLPSPTQMSQWQFEAGEPKLVQAPSCFDDPAFAIARDEALQSFQATGVPGVLRAGAAFLKYCRIVLCSNYVLSDADLNFLMGTSSKWQVGMIMHMLGGEDIIERLCAMGMVKPLNKPVPAPQVEFPGGQVLPDDAPPPSCVNHVGILKKSKKRRGILDYFRK